MNTLMAAESRAEEKESPPARMRNMLQDAMVGLIGIYRSYISPFTIKSCRHHPTCSEYAEQALREFGVFKGSAKTAWRILRCNPFSRGGYDPVIRDPRDDAQGLSQK